MNPVRRALMVGMVCALIPISGAYSADYRPFDAKAFEEAQSANRAILIHVTAPWCGTCKIQKPIVADLSQRTDFATLSQHGSARCGWLPF